MVYGMAYLCTDCDYGDALVQAHVLNVAVVTCGRVGGPMTEFDKETVQPPGYAAAEHPWKGRLNTR